MLVIPTFANDRVVHWLMAPKVAVTVPSNPEVPKAINVITPSTEPLLREKSRLTPLTAELNVTISEYPLIPLNPRN